MGAVAVRCPFKGNFDLTIINHVEPLDFDRYADPNYYWGYDSKPSASCSRPTTRAPRQGAAEARRRHQKPLADDQVNAYFCSSCRSSRWHARALGPVERSPIFANDLAALSW